MKTSQYPQLNDEAWLRQRRSEGRNATEIAEEIGCHRESINRALDRFGIERPKRGRTRHLIPQLQDKKWLKREIRDKPLRQIADELGCTAPAVNGALKRHGIPIPKRTKYRQSNKSEAVKRGIAERYPDGRTGSKSARWKGGIRVQPNGYVWLHREIVAQRWPDHPRLALEGWDSKQEHILVMEAHLGRLMAPGELVHHKNENKHDNRLENLEVRFRPGHSAHHFARASEQNARIAYLEGLLDAAGIPYEASDL